ncbi:MAG: TonB-dependent receptor [Rhodocyclaceae bacterium]|nr:TonB-dependent receptor [Rhodocyclaceae bacterium]
MVLTASRLQQTAADAPASIAVIDRRTIALSGARQVSDLIRLVPGFAIGYINGNSPVVAYHGLSDAYSRRMQVLVDGVSIYSPLWGGVDWSELPLAVEDIERIEVVRGPNAASYGANAFLGTVNILTREPAAERGGGIRMNSGRRGLSDVSAFVSGRDESLSWRISAGRREDDGFDKLPDSSRFTFLNMRGQLRLTDRDEVSLIYRHGRGRLDQGYLDHPNNGLRPRTTEADTFNVRWTRAQGPDEETWVQASAQRRRSLESLLISDVVNFPPVVPFTLRISSDYESRRNEIEFQQTTRLGANLRGVWGGQYRQDGVRSEPYFFRNDWMESDLSRLFGSLEWRPLPGLLTHVGAMYESNSIVAGAWSPRISVSMTPVDGHTLRVGASAARRTPTLFEEQGNQSFRFPNEIRSYLEGLLALPFLPPATRATIVGWLSKPMATRFLASGQLQDERILSREVSYMGSLDHGRFSWELRWFSDQLSGLISTIKVPYRTVTDTKTLDFRNMEYARERGAELALVAKPRAGTLIRVAASRNRIESDSAANVVSGPKHTTSLLVGQELPGDITASAAFYRVGAFAWLGTGGNVIPAHDTWDLRVARQFILGGRKGEIAWVSQQTRGRDLEMVDSIPRTRSSFVQLSLAF